MAPIHLCRGPQSPQDKIKRRYPLNGNALSPLTATTDLDGKCSVLFTGTEAGSYEIEAEFKDIYSDGTYTSYTGLLSIEVTDGLIWKEDFESYEVNTWPDWPEIGNWFFYSGSPDADNCIVHDGDGQSLKMHGSTTFSHWNQVWPYNTELRFTIKNGSDAPLYNGEIAPCYSQGEVAFTYWDEGVSIIYIIKLLTFYSNQGSYTIYGIDGLDLGSYSQNTPYSVIIRFNGDFGRYGSGEIVYFINGTTKSITLDQDSRMRLSSCRVLKLSVANGTTAWFDNIEFHNRAGLPQNDILKSTNNPLQINNNNL
jgi:hypothetical protein